jgi:2-dehydro-3-deoxygalactonokinase
MGWAVHVIEWVAADWGTSNLRVWAIGADGEIIAEGRSEKGMGTLRSDEFEGALLELIAPYLTSGKTLPVLCCGMVGARQGWSEAAYVSVPCRPTVGQSALRVKTSDPRISVSILPGVKQVSPPDVMRGEETQIAGFLHRSPDFDGVLCLPGTHTKWVKLHAGKIVEFKTFMTGELFALLSTQSVLRHSVTTEDFEQFAFDSALLQALECPQSMTQQLFGLRAGSLVADVEPATANARLSGLLIGTELAAARSYWHGQNVGLIGDGKLADLYQSGLSSIGINATKNNVTAMTLGGLTAAHQNLKEAAL